MLALGRRKRILLLSLTALAVVAVLPYAWYRYHFPYGRSHCCDKILSNELRTYADSHDGWFPRGEASPEASLSLLYRQDPGNAETLRGKTVPSEVVHDILERGELLSPDTCGWHYVEGLRKDDDPQLALYWDKAGLGHNGERLWGGGHRVCFIQGFQYIPEDKWPQFLEEQERLRAELKRSR